MKSLLKCCLLVAVVGTALFLLAQNYLQDLLKLLAGQVEKGSMLAELVGPESWLLWFGLLFVLSVYFFPSGIVGQLRLWAARRSAAAAAGSVRLLTEGPSSNS